MKKFKYIALRFSSFFFACLITFCFSLNVFGADNTRKRTYTTPRRNDVFMITNLTDAYVDLNYFSTFSDSRVTAFTGQFISYYQQRYNWYIPLNQLEGFSNSNWLFDDPTYFSGLDSKLYYTLEFEIFFIGFNESNVEFGINGPYADSGIQSYFESYTYGSWHAYKFSVSFDKGTDIYTSLKNSFILFDTLNYTTGLKYFGFSTTFTLTGSSENQDIIDAFGSYPKPDSGALEQYEQVESQAFGMVQSSLDGVIDDFSDVGNVLAPFQSAFIGFNNFFNKLLEQNLFLTSIILISVFIGLFGLLIGAFGSIIGHFGRKR